MLVGDYDHGRIKWADINRAITHNTSGMSVNFDQLPSQIDGLPAATVALVLLSPTLSWAVPAASFADGMSAAQPFGNSLTLRMSNNCPYARYPEGQYFINAVDGPRAFEMMGFTTNFPTMYVASTLNAAAPASTGNTTAYGLAVGIAAQFGGANSLRKIFPLGIGQNAATATFSDQIVYVFPIGVQARGSYEYEDFGDTAVPNMYLNGAGRLDSGMGTIGNCGLVSWTPQATVDNAALTVTGTWQLSAMCITHPWTKMPSPTPWNIRQISGNQSAFNARPGIREWLGFMKALTAAGAQQTHSYTTVDAQIRGTSVVDTIVTEQNILNNVAACPIPGFVQTVAENALAARAATRYSRWGVPLLMKSRSPMRSPGSTLDATVINVITSGESTHSIIDVTRTPVTAEVEAESIRWNGRPGAARFAATISGRDVDDHFAQILPGKIMSSSGNGGVANNSGAVGNMTKSAAQSVAEGKK
jgi:hypothetical protein